MINANFERELYNWTILSHTMSMSSYTCKLLADTHLLHNQHHMFVFSIVVLISLMASPANVSPVLLELTDSMMSLVSYTTEWRQTTLIYCNPAKDRK